jgi:hypothetical protein
MVNLRSLHRNGFTRYIALSLRLFVPNGLQAYSRFFFTEAVLTTSVLSLTFLPVARFSRWLFSNSSRCSLLKAARPKQSPHRVPVDPGTSPSSCFSDRWRQNYLEWRCFYISGSYSVCSLFFRFGGGRPLHIVLTLIFCSLMVVPTIRFATSSSAVFQKILPDVLSFLRRSHSFKFRPLLVFLPSWRVHYVCSTVGPFFTASLTPYRSCTAGHPSANFFRDPPSPWVCFSGYRQGPTADAFPHTASSVLQKFPLRPLPQGPPHAPPRSIFYTLQY